MGLARLVAWDPLDLRAETAITQVRVVAGSSFAVLVFGDAGREPIARAIHRESERGDGPFVAIDWSEQDDAQIAGYFDQALGGTLFLDRVDLLAPSVQLALLRALEARVRRFPARAVDARLVTGSSVDLAQLVERGRFRPDLYSRLAQYTIELPAPRRAEHIELEL